MPADDEIILLLQQRNEEGIRRIRDTYGKLCEGIAYRILGGREDAEECVNDVLLTVWNSIPPKVPEHLQAYLITLAQRGAINRLKAAGRQKRGGTYFAQALDELAEVLPSDGYVESEVEQRELARAVNNFLDGLAPDVRRVFMQRYYLSLPLRDIAEENGMNLSSVKMSLLRTRKKLKAYLKEEGLQ
ncbi:MAG: RNA polymerase sigma factor [Oscillospiraceae bacterium]|nr:RNA polymerase sigma factor [Oscillospiraceae bacterium]MCR5305050.1 RNA polymerase sigma factor [Oscillospiraceae bacterium]